ncbi:Endocuticle structural glycoprotein SgAbd-1 [Papilio xuthus]|uniref:Endocuticle structural glycoprotein SgAbd-1 n=1 Tax=Papilio xuthus TaxID=66420 RepID=A0A194Q2A4_PAPXU|nr:Endocuticle structural glycoprotein SgAbd-1 [Papilio xuthus]
MHPLIRKVHFHFPSLPYKKKGGKGKTTKLFLRDAHSSYEKRNCFHFTPVFYVVLVFITAAFLALTFASEEPEANFEDQDVSATEELFKYDQVAAQSGVRNNFAQYYQPTAAPPPYVPPSQTPQRPWNPSPSNYIPSQSTPTQNFGNYVPTSTPIPVSNYVPSQSTVNIPTSSNYIPPTQSYYPVQNDPPQNTWNQNQQQGNHGRPQNNYVSPQNSWNNNNWQNNNWNQQQQPQQPQRPQQPQPVPTTTTTSSTPTVAVIKNEQSYGENGSYKYEYEIADGTHVGEEGYFTNPKATDESIVKKGWYSFTDNNGKVYTVTYWADESGYHATGDHLPTPPPVPPAIQAAIDQNAKEEAAKAEAEKNKQPTQSVNPPQMYPQQTQNPQQVYYPQQTQKPVYYPQQTQTPMQPTQQPAVYPQQPQQTYYPQQQQTYYPQQNQQTYYPQQTQPQQNYHQSGYGK